MNMAVPEGLLPTDRACPKLRELLIGHGLHAT